MFEEITLNKLTKTPKKLSRNYRSKNALILITLKKLLESSQNTPRRYFISLLEPELCPLNPKIPNKCLSCPPPSINSYLKKFTITSYSGKCPRIWKNVELFPCITIKKLLKSAQHAPKRHV